MSYTIIIQKEKIKSNPLGVNQEVNFTITDQSQKLNVRIESHALPPKYGGDFVTPQRHMNVELRPESNPPLKNNGHVILDN